MAKLTETYNLKAIDPKLAKQWHPTKNGNLTPKDVLPRSNKKVWWQCEKGHEWPAVINDRMKGTGCPICAGRSLKDNKNFQETYPKIAEEWHPAKNGNLTPKDVAKKSRKKVWWICKKGHEWQAAVSKRAIGSGCPYCAGKLTSKDRNLKVLNPKLAQEWHPTKNGDLRPEKTLPGAHKKVWWQCKEGHEWQAYVFARTKGNRTGCPYCYRIKRLPKSPLKKLLFVRKELINTNY